MTPMEITVAKRKELEQRYHDLCDAARKERDFNMHTLQNTCTHFVTGNSLERNTSALWKCVACQKTWAYFPKEKDDVVFL